MRIGTVVLAGLLASVASTSGASARGHEIVMSRPVGIALPAHTRAAESSAGAREASGSWIATGRMAVPRYGHSATLLADGRVLVAGGATRNKRLRSAEIFDPASETWRRTRPMARKRAGHLALLLESGKVLVAGGFYRAPDYPITAEIYDPSTERWSQVRAPLGTNGVGSLTLVSLGERGVLVLGDHGSATILDPNSRTVRPAASLPFPVNYFSAVGLADGRVLVVGGFVSPGISTSSCEIYNPATDTWSPTADVPALVSFPLVALLRDGRVLAAGGTYLDDTGGRGVDTAAIYDPATEAWESTGDLLIRCWTVENRIARLEGGSVLVTCTTGDDCTRSELLNLETLQWELAPNQLECRPSGTATCLLDGRVLVAGGFTIVDERLRGLDTAELYNP